MLEKVIVVGLLLPDLGRSVAEEHLEELEKLVSAAGGSVVDRVLARRPAPDPATYVGRGKADELAHLAASLDVSLVVFDDDLSPAQARNLEKLIPAKVIDRSGLILDIFAGRARSREARTQVELAQMEYLLPRLTRQWSHLSRQAGGIGTRGVGETQLEIDRRIVRNRIARLKEDLEKIERTRDTQRKMRGAAYTVALVGYTNAGKSTLFNALTGGGAEAVDALFVTLDSKSQRASFEAPRETVIIDTVGFIRKLPHHLVASFRSTMEEAVSADLVLHVIDASHPQYEEHQAIGDEVLQELGVEPHSVIEVYNKNDRFEAPWAPRRDGDRAVTVSALSGRGVERLIELIRERQLAGGELMHLAVPHAESRVAAQLHELAQVYDTEVRDEATLFTVWVPRDAVHLFDSFATGQIARAKVS